MVQVKSSNVATFRMEKTIQFFYNIPAKFKDLINQSKMKIESLCFRWQVVDCLQPCFRHSDCLQCRYKSIII